MWQGMGLFTVCEITWWFSLISNVHYTVLQHFVLIKKSYTLLDTAFGKDLHCSCIFSRNGKWGHYMSLRTCTCVHCQGPEDILPLHLLGFWLPDLWACLDTECKRLALKWAVAGSCVVRPQWGSLLCLGVAFKLRLSSSVPSCSGLAPGHAPCWSGP